MSGIEGMDRFGTGPVRSAYFMLSSTELQSDMDTLVGQGFLNQWNYKNLCNSKIVTNYQETLELVA